MLRKLATHLLTFLVFWGTNGGQNLLGQSVLATGNWTKMAVTETGIYKIDFNWLESAGFNPSSLDPATLQIYGKPGGMLPQENSVFRGNDLQEIAVYGSGLDDQSFDGQDFLLFYAQGPHKAILNNQGTLLYERNLYADTAYYFITAGSTAGKRMEMIPDEGDTHASISSYQGFKIHEADLENILSSGREWYGELLANGAPQQIDFSDIPALVGGSNIRVISAAVNRSENTGTLNYTINGLELGTSIIGPIGSGTYDPRGVNKVDTFTINQAVLGSPQEAVVSIDFQSNSGGRGNLNYLVMLYEAKLEYPGFVIPFTSPQSTQQALSTYTLDNAPSDLLIWNITDPRNSAIQEFGFSGDQAVFGATSNTLHHYAAFSSSDATAPLLMGPVGNQDLKNYPTPDLLIVANHQWKVEADRLAAFRQQNDQLSVRVVTPQEIYNEFSAGAQDVTAIRDYVRYLYEKEPVLKYLLLFGRCSFDYKNITDDNTNFVPTYQSRNSLDPIFSHNSDDYFAFLDDDEGQWDESLSGIGGHIMDISVGRLPATNLQEAQIIVDKLIHYATDTATLGSWRQDIYYIADDGDFNLHQRDADQLATLVDTANQEFNVNKIFLDAFPQEQTPNGESAEAVNQSIDEAVKKGALIINYTGHGSEFRWAEETILNQNMINSWDNYDRLPFFVTATCEFGRHDDPKRISGAEQLLTNPHGGAIGLVTTARPVFASKNFILNRAFYEVALESDENGYHTVGDIFKFVKNDSYTIVANRNFALLGDPSMKLSYPQNKVVITSIQKNQQIPGDTVEALSLVKLTGEIVDAGGNTLSSYQGTTEVTVFDKETISETLGSDGGRVFTFKERKNVIFRGLASIEQGTFEIEFVVPKNINYQVGQGKISLYGVNQSGTMDAGGATISFVIGGSNKNAPVDNTPPEISLYMDDTSFRSGNSTGKNTMLLARLSDQNGINISNTGFGQDITASLNDDDPIVLNDFYRADVDSYQSGWINYPVTDLVEGNYTLNLKAWDVYNNSNEAALDFVVVENPALALHRVFNYPNPFWESTIFQIDHNQAGSPLEVAIFIYNQKGQLVRTIIRVFDNSPSTIEDISWSGTDSYGAPLRSGLYLYKVIVRSVTNGDKSEEFRKLVLIK
ncbi:MAG: type IX secretion system sortase PorU [Cyclobacteriaceae bacterium]|nr:type IX secretion system sortase PorU [Cyclobacteriaceae bacterium]